MNPSDDLRDLEDVATNQPNIVFILSDDQDAKLNSLDYMPLLQKHLMSKGTHFQKHYCTVAWCCPSRVSLWTGKAAHNTNVTNVVPPFGGYPQFLDRHLNESWVPLWLQENGYNTYYTGKLMNYHTVDNYNNPYPSGFNGTDFLLDPGTYSYLNPIFQRNKDAPVNHTNEYNTDLVAKKGLGLIDEAVQGGQGRPFFVTIAPIAPHADFEIVYTEDHEYVRTINSPPVSAERHKDLFPDEIVPRTPNFNPLDKPSGVDFLAELEPLSDENITYNDHWHRQRLRSLQVIDELVEDVVQKLEKYGILDNTYIFYSSDNGYHISQHRLQPGKGCGWEEDINVPLIVRGPNIPAGGVVDFPTSHTDLAPTWFKVLGIPLREDFDGLPIPLTADEITEWEGSGKAKEHVQIEFWSDITGGEYNTPPAGISNPAPDNTYKGLRILGEYYSFYYSVWCSGSHQLYDMTTDPYQLNNLYQTASSEISSPPTNTTVTICNANYTLVKVTQRLDSLLFVLKTCTGKACSDPWNSLMPNTGINSLRQAMDPKYDSFFENMKRVGYERCEGGYIPDAEGEVYESGDAYQGGEKLRLARDPREWWNRA
ncbi:Arylsulphatase [Lojkania enalia]|uniref:Arylsulfatase n=1 Tax=Lojkania enalia TaxID=147567 RepID=A0A9P4JY15_9PLEO|nr:Arylsulphatase [Didymosphaeria enalia]